MLQQKFVDLFARGSDVILSVAERDVVLTYVLRILADGGLSVITLHFEEIVAEKVRASYQRTTARDVYDLFQFQQRPFDRDLVRTLAVLKCWLVGDPFDPDRFFANIRSGRYEWGDLTRLIRRDRRPETETVIAGCMEGYRFLQDLSPYEAELAKDPHQRRKDLFESILKGLSPLS
ncbi:MAG TPA: hypothetical protein EYP49_02060 [Anaerolineae bacterium]|nr:hypothetical protein [Anaerolineae bacterium]